MKTIFKLTKKKLGENGWKKVEEQTADSVYSLMGEFYRQIAQSQTKGNDCISLTISDNFKTIYATFSIR